MTDRSTSTPERFGAGRYEIRVTGHLDARWSASFDGLAIRHQQDGTTVISGPVADQAALHGLIQRVRDLGVPLVSVMRVPSGQRSTTVKAADQPPTNGLRSSHNNRKETR